MFHVLLPFLIGVSASGRNLVKERIDCDKNANKGSFFWSHGQVDRGVPLGEALFMHDKWLEDKGIKYTNFAVVTWSSWDCRVMLESECRLKSLRKPPYFNRYVLLLFLSSAMMVSVRVPSESV